NPLHNQEHLSAQYQSSGPLPVAEATATLEKVVQTVQNVKPESTISYISFPDTEFGITGHFLVSIGDPYRHYHDALWFYLKIALVAFLVLYHLACGYYRKKLLDNAHYKTHVFWRFFNEAPTFALVAIIILVVVKPHF
ncbi:MAG: hypothetical protein EOO68_19250, partial [Moraxellaceae bacterium]